MPVTEEPRLRINPMLPDTSSVRGSLAGPIINAVRSHSSKWTSECDRLGEEYVIAYLRDVVSGLPDDDILDLSYVHREKGPQHLAYAFCGKLTEYNALAHRVSSCARGIDQ